MATRKQDKKLDYVIDEIKAFDKIADPDQSEPKKIEIKHSNGPNGSTIKIIIDYAAGSSFDYDSDTDDSY